MSNSPLPGIERERYDHHIPTDGAGFGESRPKFVRSESSSSVNVAKLGKVPQIAKVQGPASTDTSGVGASRPPLIRSESGSNVNTVKLGKVSQKSKAQRPTPADSDGSGGSRPKLIRSESGSNVSSSRLSKFSQVAKVRRPKSNSNPLPPSNGKALMRAATAPAPTKSRRPSRLGVSQLRPHSSNPEPGPKVSRPRRIFKAYSARPFHQLIHSGRKKDWKSPVPTDPPGIEDIDAPYVEKFRVDSSFLLPSVLKIFEDEQEPTQSKGRGIVADTGGLNAGDAYDDRKGNSKPRRKGKSVSRSSDEEGSTITMPTMEGDTSESSNPDRGKHHRLKANAKRAMDLTGTKDLPPALASSGPNRRPKKTKVKVAQFEVKQEDNDYRPRGAALDLESIPENRALRTPRTRSKPDAEPEKPDHDVNDPLITWYFPRRSPDYWEMLDDVAKMFEDLHLQEVTLKHFQRPIDYVTVLLCLSNIVFAEMFQTLQEKVTDGQYRIEFVTNGRTGVNLYLSAYSREHTYIAKSLMHKVNVQLDLAKKHSPRSTIQYIHLIECVERALVHDKRKSWGRVPDGRYSTWTDIESPAVIHEVGIAESRAELYRRCKRYLQDVASVNLVVAIKVDSTECEWAELLVLARDPGDNRICKVCNWVRFWGEGAVNGGELRYYPSDFLEVEDRWKIPRAHMRPLDILDGPRSVHRALTSMSITMLQLTLHFSCAIVKISFGELGRMVSLAKWENQALMGYIKKYGPFWTDFPCPDCELT